MGDFLRLTRLARVGAVAFVVGTLFLAGLQAAEATEHDRVVSADPADWTPQVLDGRVRGIATVGDTTVAVGDFSQVQEQGSSAVLARSDIFAFDSSGRISTTFVPAVAGSEIYDVIPAGDGQTVYIAGSFKSVNGVPGTGRVARLNVTTGQVVKTFKSPTFNNRATALDLVNGKLYVGGWFTRVGGQPRTLLTALNPETGADLGSLNVTFAGTWNGGYLSVSDMTVRPDGSALVVIGNFRTVNGQSRPQIALIDLTKSPAQLSTWATTRYSTTCSSRFETYMYSVDASPDGKYFAVGTTGAYSGGPTTGTLCDSVTRWEFGATGASQQPTWIDYTGGDTVTRVEVTGTAVYAGGHFRWMNNPFASDRPGAGAVPRKGLAALDPRNGLPFTWNPTRKRGWGVWGFASTPQGLWIGHDTDTVGGELHQRLAFMPYDSSGQLPADNTGALPGEVYLLGKDGNAVEGRAFDGSTASAPTAVGDGGVAWDSVRGAFMVDGQLYTGWSDGTFTHRTFNGSAFGAAKTVDLNGLTSFSTELPTVQAMWFDRATGRLYFTLQGVNKLYYRYFTPQSRTVGAIRYEVPVGSVDFSQVTGGFLAGGKLYYRTSDGSLKRADWNGGIVGTPTTVSGPGVDGTNWNSRALFLSAS